MSWDKAAITGVGTSRMGKFPGVTSNQLAKEAFVNALNDAGIPKDEIDGLITMPGTTSPEGAKHYLALGELLGINPRIAWSLSMGGATVGTLITQAALAIEAGMATTVAVVFGDAAKTGGSRFNAAAGDDDSWGIWGMFGNAANSAIAASRHMAVYGTTSEQLGWIGVTTRRHAALNPNAIMREPFTIDDHQNSRMIVDPLHLLDCCIISDGAVAIIVTSPERARDNATHPVRIMGMGQSHSLQKLGKEDWWYMPHQREAIFDAYRMAGVGPSDIDVAQLYDNFTISVILWLEHAGFVKPGEAGPFVEGGGRISLGGELPINTSGGNLSESYMQGWLHVVEGVRQMRHECGPRQVPGAEVTLVTGRGMTLNTSAALVLGR
jgi:acetyl-CoA acetyltransferase